MSRVFTKGEIESVLSVLEEEYLKVYKLTTPRSSRLMRSYSEISVISLAGWIESGMKSLSHISTGVLKEQKNGRKIDDLILEIHGFSYKNHFSKVLILCFGIHGYEYVESKVGTSDIARLESSLGNLKKWRDTVAHSRVTIPCDPSRIRREFKSIFPILRNLEQVCRKYKLENF